MYSVTATFSQEQIKLSGTRQVEMYVINASLSGHDFLYYVNNNQDIYGFNMTASGNLGATDSQTYTGLPIERGLIKNSLDGQITEVSVTVPNVNRVMESIIQGNNYLRGNEVHIITGFAKNLPSGPTAKHIGETPDRFAIIPEKMYIDSVTSDENVVVFSCKPKFTLRNVILPGRTFSKECSWAFKGKYRCTECLGNGSINATTFPNCDGTLEQCRERQNTARFGGFPAIPSRGFSVIS